MQSLKSKIIISLIKNRQFLKLKFKPEIVDETFSVNEFRERIDRATQRMTKIPEDIIVEKVNIEGVEGCWVIPKEEVQGKAVLYVHGGGFISGSCDTHIMHMIKIVRKTRIRVLLFNYRLAPEHQYPAALNDCLKAYKWMLNHGYASKNIVIAGESAGGCLALSTIIAARDKGMVLPKAIIAISTCTDLTCSSDSLVYNARNDIAPMNSWKVWTGYYIGNNDPTVSYLSPLFDHLEGLIPMKLLVGSNETYLDDMKRFAEKAKKVGNIVDLTIYDGMVHGFPFLPIPEGESALNEMSNYIKRHLVG